MRIADNILADFRNLCRYTREHENFKPIPKKLLTKHWAESDEEYRNFLLEALKYYFNERDYRRILREEIKLDELAMGVHDAEKYAVENPQENPCMALVKVR